MQNLHRTLPPQVPRIRSFLDSRLMKDNPVRVFEEYRSRYGATFAFHFGGLKKVFVTSNPNLARHILKDNFENYEKSEIEMTRMVHFLGRGLLTSHGKYWHTQRRLIQQGFHKARLTLMMEGMQHIMDESLDKMEGRLNSDYIAVHQWMNQLTFRMVMKSLFSTRLREQELDSISDTISKVQEFLVRQIVQPYLNPWFRISGTLRKYDNLRYSCDRIIYEYIKNRRGEENQYNDLLQILMDARYSDTGEGMTDPQILAESIQLMVAGHETTSTALSWILYLLCKHPETVTKIRDEIQREIGESPLRFADIPRLEYTTQVIDEALRMYPPFWMVDRVALQDDRAEGIDIPKGTTVITFIYGVHHSAGYWENPEEFNPDRFSAENRKKQHPFAHIPFGAGPKGCIGGNYAMMQMLLILVNLVRKFDFELEPGNEVVIQPMLILRPGSGLRVRFPRLTQSSSPQYQGITS